MRYGSLSALPKRTISGDGAYAKERIPKPDPLRHIPHNYHRYGIKQEIFLKYINSIPEPDLVMVTSMMTYWYPGVFDIAGLVHRTFPSVPVVLGGSYVTLCPQHATRSGVDFLLGGPGEISIPILLKDLFNQDMNFIPDIEDLNSHPYPALDLITHPDHVPITNSMGSLPLPLQLLCISHYQQPFSETRSHPGRR
jgi:radical SAM superfamily enzyme YgiQ (UPF0313 family)